MATLHCMGLPHVGPQRELSHALERYGSGRICREDLDNTASILRHAQWQRQIESGAAFITVGDFYCTDRLLEQSLMFGLAPDAHLELTGLDVMDQAIALYRTTRQGQLQSTPESASDGDQGGLIHYFDADSPLRLDARHLIAQLQEASSLGTPTKLALIGPATLAWHCQRDAPDVDDLIDRLLPLYQQLFSLAVEHGVVWIQLEEPILCTDLAIAWRARFERIYNVLRTAPAPILLATYGGGLNANLSLTLQLPVQAVHVDLVAAPDQLVRVRDQLGPYKALSLGLVDGLRPGNSVPEPGDPALQALAREMDDQLWLSTNCAIAADESSPEHSANCYRGMESALAELSALQVTLNSPPELRAGSRPPRMDAAGRRA